MKITHEAEDQAEQSAFADHYRVSIREIEQARQTFNKGFLQERDHYLINNPADDQCKRCLDDIHVRRRKAEKFVIAASYSMVFPPIGMVLFLWEILTYFWYMKVFRKRRGNDE